MKSEEGESGLMSVLMQSSSGDTSDATNQQNDADLSTTDKSHQSTSAAAGDEETVATLMMPLQDNEIESEMFAHSETSEKSFSSLIKDQASLSEPSKKRDTSEERNKEVVPVKASRTANSGANNEISVHTLTIMTTWSLICLKYFQS